MVPRGNMMHCMLKEEEGSTNLNQVKFNITGKEPPADILEVETDIADFLEAGITNINREGIANNLKIFILSGSNPWLDL